MIPKLGMGMGEKRGSLKDAGGGGNKSHLSAKGDELRSDRRRANVSHRIVLGNREQPRLLRLLLTPIDP